MKPQKDELTCVSKNHNVQNHNHKHFLFQKHTQFDYSIFLKIWIVLLLMIECFYMMNKLSFASKLVNVKS